jgi:hypothetical protein
MENNINIETKIFGIVSIIISLFYIVYYILPFFVSVLGGWVGDLSIKSSSHQALLYLIWRLSVAIIFISSFSLLRSGILIIRLDQRGRKAAIIFGLFVIVGLILNFLSDVIETMFLEIGFFSGINLSDLILVIALFILIMEMVYLNSQSVKEIFNDENIRMPFRKPIVAIGIAYIFPTLIFLITKLLYIGRLIK